MTYKTLKNIDKSLKKRHTQTRAIILEPRAKATTAAAAKNPSAAVTKAASPDAATTKTSAAATTVASGDLSDNITKKRGRGRPRKKPQI